MKNDIFHRLRVLFKGCIQREIVCLAERLQNGIGKAAFIGTGLPAGHHNGSLIDGQFLVGNHQIHIKFHFVAQAKAVRACAERVVEGKAPGLYFTDADAAVRAGKALAERHGLSADDIHDKKPFRQGKGILHGVRQTRSDAVLDHQSVHHNFYVMLDIFFQFDFFGKVVQIAVNPHSDITAPLGSLQNLGVLALSAPDYRRQKLDFRAFR